MAVEAKAQGVQIIPAMITATPQHQAQQDLSRYLGPLQQQCLMEELVVAEDHNGNSIINMAVLWEETRVAALELTRLRKANRELMALAVAVVAAAASKIRREPMEAAAEMDV